MAGVMALASAKSSSFAVGRAEAPPLRTRKTLPGFEIAMHDAGTVSCVECRHNLDRELERVRHRQR